MKPCISSDGRSASASPVKSVTRVEPSATSGLVFIRAEIGRWAYSARPYSAAIRRKKLFRSMMPTGRSSASTTGRISKSGSC